MFFDMSTAVVLYNALLVPSVLVTCKQENFTKVWGRISIACEVTEVVNEVSQITC